MAIPSFVESVGVALELPSAVSENLLRSLRAAGLLPLGARRGQGPVWTPHEYAVFLLGAAASAAVEAPDVVRTFSGMVFESSPDAADQDPRLGPGTLLAAWTRAIEQAGQDQSEPDALPHSWILHLSEPRRVEAIWLAPDGRTRARTEIYGATDAPTQSSAGFSRSVTVSGKALAAAGRVWRETSARPTPEAPSVVGLAAAVVPT